MKKIIYILLILQIACSPKECFEGEGKTVTREIEVPNFTKILVGNEISLILKQGTIQKVEVKTGDNLIDNISVEVKENELQLEDKTTCNFVRDYAITKVIVTSPNIKQIRSNTARLIKSEGVLHYPELVLQSEDNADHSLLNIGDFNLQVDATKLSIVFNGSSVAKISGNVTNLTVGFYSGTSRFEGKNLIAQHVHVIQKSTNDMLVYPVQSISGELFSIGNVISFNVPPEIEVEEHYTGKLIFN